MAETLASQHPIAPDAPMSGVDSAWLRMDNPTNRMIITSLMVFETPIGLEALRALLYERLASYDRFRQAAIENPRVIGKPTWVENDFRIEDHVVPAELDAPADEATLKALVGAVMARPLDPTKPLWHMLYIENLQDAGCVVVSRVHHCIGDGMALIKVMLDIADAMPDDAIPGAVGARKQSGHTASLGALAKAGRAAAIGGKSVGALTRLLAMPSDPSTPYKGKLGVFKTATWSDNLPLDEVKRVGRALGGTVNDVLLTMVADAMRRDLLRRGASLPDDGRFDLKALIPVNLRPPKANDQLGNRFGLVFLDLPVGVSGTVERLRELKRRMDVIKRSPEAFVIFSLLSIFGHTTPRIEAAAVNLFSQKATGVMTNVPGPRVPISIAGATVRDLMFWVPISGGLGVGLSILSYRGSVRIGLATDAGLVPDPERIVEAFGDAFDALREAADAGASIAS